jgi:hypothetical protein
MQVHKDFKECGPHGTEPQRMTIDYHKISGTYLISIDEEGLQTQSVSIGEVGIDILEQLIKQIKELT